eukprot:3208988-Rhodomonas_salina.1
MALYFDADSNETELDCNNEVSKLKARECARCDVKYGHFNPSTIRLIIVCLLLILSVLYSRSQEYFDDDDFRLAIHYEQCMEWMSNAEFYDFHVFPPWERDIEQRDMQVEGA